MGKGRDRHAWKHKGKSISILHPIAMYTYTAFAFCLLVSFYRWLSCFLVFLKNQQAPGFPLTPASQQSTPSIQNVSHQPGLASAYPSSCVSAGVVEDASKQQKSKNNDQPPERFLFCFRAKLRPRANNKK